MDRGQGRRAFLETLQKTQFLSPTFISLYVIAFLSTTVSGMHSSIEVEALSTTGRICSIVIITDTLYGVVIR